MTSPAPASPRAARRVRVLLADDHALVRQAVKSMLQRAGFEVVGETSDGVEAVRQCSELQPDVAVLDFSMPLLNGIEAARKIFELSPDTKVVLLSMHTENQYVLESLYAGVKGYVSKTNPAAELMHALDAVCRGQIYLTRSISPAVLEAYRKREGSADRLASRERQVLCQIAEGKSTRQIAALLGISHKTVQCHRANIMEKLGLQDTASLVRYAVSCGLIGSGLGL